MEVIKRYLLAFRKKIWADGTADTLGKNNYGPRTRTLNLDQDKDLDPGRGSRSRTWTKVQDKNLGPGQGPRSRTRT